MNSAGRAQLKSKSINVEANILHQWLEERRLLDQRTKMRWSIVLGMLLATALLLPGLASLTHSTGTKENEVAQQLADLSRREDALGKRGKAAEPMIQYGEMLAREQRSQKVFLGEVVQLFNATPHKMAIDRLKVEVSGGVMTLSGSANAEDVESGKTFISEIGKGAKVTLAIQESSKRSTLLGPQGIAFDYVKKVGVAR